VILLKAVFLNTFLYEGRNSATVGLPVFFFTPSGRVWEAGSGMHFRVFLYWFDFYVFLDHIDHFHIWKTDVVKRKWCLKWCLSWPMRVLCAQQTDRQINRVSKSEDYQCVYHFRAELQFCQHNLKFGCKRSQVFVYTGVETAEVTSLQHTPWLRSCASGRNLKSFIRIRNKGGGWLSAANQRASKLKWLQNWQWGIKQKGINQGMGLMWHGMPWTHVKERRLPYDSKLGGGGGVNCDVFIIYLCMN
jgi:hypothetical protein